MEGEIKSVYLGSTLSSGSGSHETQPVLTGVQDVGQHGHDTELMLLTGLLGNVFVDYLHEDRAVVQRNTQRSLHDIS